MYSELKFINKIYLEKSIGSGLATNAPCGAQAFKKIDHDGQKIQLRKLSEHNAPLVLELTIISVDSIVSNKLLITDNNYQSTQSFSIKISRIREFEKIELMRKREFCYSRSIRNKRDCRSASDSSQILQKFKRKISNSQILDKIKIEKIAQIGNYCQL